MKVLRKTAVLMVAALLACTMAITAFAQVPDTSIPDTNSANAVTSDTANENLARTDVANDERSGITSTAPISAPDTGMGSALPGLLLVVGAGAVGLALMKEKN